MESNGRKEVIQVNGLTILLVMALLANFFVVGLVYRWHNYQVFLLEKKHSIEYAELLQKERNMKNEIIQLEGVSAWDDTEYVRSLK